MKPNTIQVLELRSVRGTGGGPEKTILQGAIRADLNVFEITVCYLRDARDAVFRIDEQARSLGVRYHEIVERHSFDVSAWKQLRHLVRTRRIAIVHAHEYKTDLLAHWLARTERTIALATVHGWTGHSTRERLVYYPLDKRILARFPQLIAVSTEIRNELLRKGAAPEHVATVLNGIDPVAFRRTTSEEPRVRATLGLRGTDFVIGCVGRLELQKRFDLLIEAFARLRERFSNLKMLIAGEGSQREAMVAMIDRYGLDGSCRLLGHRTDVVSLHHAFDLFVQSSDYEGTPNAVLEAMALATPVVATAAGGTVELIRHEIDGLIVPVGDVQALVAAIERSISDPVDSARRAASARARVEADLSFDARTRKVESIYRDLVHRRQSGTL
jgi:glycosyltransferase involved in cell wall biosynthesis